MMSSQLAISLTVRPTNRWTGATGSVFRIKRDPAKLLGSAVARSTLPFGVMETNFPSGSPTFGDNVRIRPSPETESKGLAGLVGNVYGQKTPSVSAVEVIGELTSDYAINVFFEDRHESFWFAPALVEFVDHTSGTEITLDGVPKKWVRTDNGEWREESVETKSTKPWWRFWN
jgi:hypothetical protein